MKGTYYFFYLEMALKAPNDPNVYAYVNLSHIQTQKLCEIFEINLEIDPLILEGYFLTKKNYKKYRKFIDKHFGTINLNHFEYCLRQYVAENFDEVRKLYKEHLME